jgi:hypothetical protein
MLNDPKEETDRREGAYEKTKETAKESLNWAMEVISRLFFGSFAIIGVLSLGLSAYILSHSKPKTDRSTRVITTASVIILVTIAFFVFGILLKGALG